MLDHRGPVTGVDPRINGLFSAVSRTLAADQSMICRVGVGTAIGQCAPSSSMRAPD